MTLLKKPNFDEVLQSCKVYTGVCDGCPYWTNGLIIEMTHPPRPIKRLEEYEESPAHDKITTVVRKYIRGYYPMELKLKKFEGGDAILVVNTDKAVLDVLVGKSPMTVRVSTVSYTHLTLPTKRIV